ncbi:MAG: hypothetical protein D8M59_10715 [Planctomycetes bacterium]|nr:hypothetical protein [Planctomycetota bacterium]
MIEQQSPSIFEYQVVDLLQRAGTPRWCIPRSIRNQSAHQVQVNDLTLYYALFSDWDARYIG